MGTTGRVLWEAAPELLHLGAVICTAAVMVGIMGSTLFGFRAQAVSSLSCKFIVGIISNTVFGFRAEAVSSLACKFIVGSALAPA